MSNPQTVIKVFVLTTKYPDCKEGISPNAARIFKAFAPNWDQKEHFQIERTPIFMDLVESGEFDPEYFVYLQFLDNKPQEDPRTIYTIFIRDSAITNAHAHTVVEAIEDVIKHNTPGTSIQDIKESDTTFDICYLGKWLDRCDKYNKLWDITERGLSAYDTFSPHGTMALMFSPRGASKFMSMEPIRKSRHRENQITLGYALHSFIGNRQTSNRFTAITTHPSLFTFDINQAKSEFDYLKLTECANISASTKPHKRKGDMSLYVFIIVAAIIIIAIYFLIRYGSYISKSVSQGRITPHISPC